MPNPNLTTDLSIPDAGDIWRPKASSNGNMTATGSDHSGNYSRAVVHDGKVVAQSGKTSIGSSATPSAESNAAQNVPYAYAMDAKTRCRISPDQITDDSILSYPNGSQVTARQAREMGWLASNSASNAPAAKEAGNEAPFEQANEPKTEEHEDLKSEALADPALEQELSSLINNSGGFEQLSAVKEIIEDGSINERTLGTLASQLRCEPGQLQERLTPILAGFESQARAIMGEGGVNADEVIEFAQTHKRDELHRAMHRHGTMRNPDGYAPLRTAYLESLGELYPERALAADLGPGNVAYKDTKGRVLVRLANGAEMEWRTAIRAFGGKK